MAQRSRLKLAPLKLGRESIGERLSRLRRERGYSQVALARKIGIIQEMVSSYERGRLRLHAEMVARFALALGVSSDEILGLKASGNGGKPSRKVFRRLQQVEALPPQDQRTLLKTIDTFLKAARV